MYSKNAYIYPHASPSSHPARASASVIGLNGSELFLHHHHHHHHEMFPGHLNAALYNQDVGGGGVDPYSAVANQPCGGARAAGTKKDRHSKINTAQGPRDRRVRLSIGVARKFFDLQEILGFDKPSKTLDWLLTKSKAAITDLEQLRAKAKSDDSECGEVDSENETDSRNKSTLDESKLKASSLAKESRAKARARARERTREKMKLNETGNHGQLMNNNQLEFRKISASSGSSSSSNINLGFHEATNEDLIQESIVIKRKVKHQYPSILGFQQNLIISSSNYGVPTPYNAAADNWDNICAILDHHKFINSTSNN